jgi:hypothetical protein
MATKTATLLKDARLVAVVPPGPLALELTEFGWVVRGGLPVEWRPAVHVKAFPLPVDPAELAAVVGGFGPLAFTLGPVCCRPGRDGRQVVYVDAVSLAAQDLNWMLGERYGWGADAGGYAPRLEVTASGDDRLRRLDGDLRFINRPFTVEALALLSPRRAARVVQL